MPSCARWDQPSERRPQAVRNGGYRPPHRRLRAAWLALRVVAMLLAYGTAIGLLVAWLDAALEAVR